MGVKTVLCVSSRENRIKELGLYKTTNGKILNSAYQQIGSWKKGVAHITFDPEKLVRRLQKEIRHLDSERLLKLAKELNVIVE